MGSRCRGCSGASGDITRSVRRNRSRARGACPATGGPRAAGRSAEGAASPRGPPERARVFACIADRGSAVLADDGHRGGKSRRTLRQRVCAQPWQATLNDALAAMGMRRAFSRAADFSGIASGVGLGIREVSHAASVDVDEVGAEATAVTWVGLALLCDVVPKAVIRADHPFVYFVRDDRTGVILFLGRVMDPSAR
jgi:hypothetical protein